MKAVVRTIGDISVVDLDGKITIGKGDVTLRETVLGLLGDGSRKILLNLESVSYMDSAGIGEVVACLKRVNDKEGRIKLLNPSGKVYDALQMTKLDQIFETYGDEKEALVSFGMD
jgi:anti-sigma B factor antagonist